MDTPTSPLFPAPSASIPVSPSAGLPAFSGPFRRAALLIALLAVVVRLWMAYVTHSTAEDFLITLRYAENIAQGRGFVFNSGERVLGTTTPLYALLLAGCALLPLDAAWCGKIINILADGLTCFLLARFLARPRIGQPIAGLFAALLYALGSTPISISISGMETALVTCAGVAAIDAALMDRSRALLLLCAVLFLLRIDSLLLSGCLLTAHIGRMRRVSWPDVGMAVLVTLPWIVFACAYFGSPIPASLTAKVIVYAQSMTDRSAVYGPFRTQFITGAMQRVLTLLFLAGAWRVLRRRDWWLLAPLAWLLLYYGIMLTSRVPAFAWYFLPPWPLFLAIAMLGAGRLWECSTSLLPPVLAVRRARLWQAAFAVLGAFGLLHLRPVRADIAKAQELEDRVRHPLGLWLRVHTRPDERILLEPIGTIGYYSQRRLIDMIGLVSPEALPSYHTPCPLADMIHRLRPDWLCLRPGEAAVLQHTDPHLLNAQYALARDFRDDNGRQVFVLLHRRRQEEGPSLPLRGTMNQERRTKRNSHGK